LSERSERIRNLLKLREFLKKRIDRLEKELIRLRQMMESLDEVLLEQTLVTADQLRPSLTTATPQKEDIEEREIVSEDGTLLGIVRINKSVGFLVFVPSEDVTIDARERPISSFLIRKVEEYGGKCEVEEFPDGRLKALRVKFEGVPQELERMFRLLRWAITKSVVQ